jgi:tRNA (guanine37-N1)-methyltransferase
LPTPGYAVGSGEWFDGPGRKRHWKAMTSQATIWRTTVLTLFPEMFPGPLGVSLAGKAMSSGLWALEARDIRDSATDRHRSVDDTPAGGGPGMVLRADVLAAAIDAADAVPGTAKERPRLLMSPRGRPLTQSRVTELATGPGPLIICGRFEGIDERVIGARSLEEVSIGDYVLSGGELAAMALIDACVRLLPGVMGKQESGADESFSDGLLEYPQYTRPQTFEGQPIPEILLSGDHAKVAAWRRAEAEALTRARRPDLWAKRPNPPQVLMRRQNRPKKTTDG